MRLAVASEDEYIEVDGLPFDTPAWSHENLGEVYNSPTVRGSGTTLSQRKGEKPTARIVGPKRVQAELLVAGHHDSDGNPTSGLLSGLRGNLDELKRTLRPRGNASGGTVPLRHRLDDGSVRETPCQITSELDVEQAGEGAYATVDLWLPEGVLRATTLTSASATDAFPLAVPNPGTDDQLDATITLSGDATTVTLTNSTWGPDTDLTVAVDLSNGDVTIDTGDMTAVQGSTDVIASVSHRTDGAFPARWLPLLAGQDNNIGVSHDGTTLSVSIEHAARWL